MPKTEMIRRKDFQTRPQHKRDKRVTGRGRDWRLKPVTRLTDEQRELIKQYLYLIPIAIKGHPKIFDVEEAESIGRLALCQAVQGYRSCDGAIRPYLIAKIRYLLLDAARDAGFIRCRYRYDIPINHFFAKPLSYNATCETAYEAADPRDFEQSQDRKDWHQAFHAIVSRFPVEDSLVIRMTIEGYTLRQIGEVLGISESRVSQIRPEILERLAERLRNRGLDR